MDRGVGSSGWRLPLGSVACFGRIDRSHQSDARNVLRADAPPHFGGDDRRWIKGAGHVEYHESKNAGSAALVDRAHLDAWFAALAN